MSDIFGWLDVAYTLLSRLECLFLRVVFFWQDKVWKYMRCFSKYSKWCVLNFPLQPSVFKLVRCNWWYLRHTIVSSIHPHNKHLSHHYLHTNQCLVLSMVIPQEGSLEKGRYRSSKTKKLSHYMSKYILGGQTEDGCI